MSELTAVRSGVVVPLIVRGVFIELLRRKDAFVLFFLMLIFAIGAFATGFMGIDNASTGTFLLNLGMSLVYFMAHLATLMLAFRQIPNEIESRTIYPILARPIGRSHYILGKWAACSLCGMLVYLILFMLGWLPVPKMESYDAVLLIQTVILHLLSIELIAALAILVSVMAGRMIFFLVLGAWFLLGSKLVQAISYQLKDRASEGLFSWLTAYLPDFSKLNLLTRYTDGISALAWPEFGGLIVYGLLFSAFTLCLSVWIFSRRTL